MEYDIVVKPEDSVFNISGNVDNPSYKGSKQQNNISEELQKQIKNS